MDFISITGSSQLSKLDSKAYFSDKGSWPQMEDIGWMYNGIRDVTRSDEIFLIQGILMRFDMMDCKSMTTPMMTNLKKFSDSTSDSDLVGPTTYR
jgi:hypothetical protein